MITVSYTHLDVYKRQPYAFAFAKGSSLVDQVNTALQELLQDGTVEKLFQEYDTVYVSPLS